MTSNGRWRMWSAAWWVVACGCAFDSRGAELPTVAGHAQTLSATAIATERVPGIVQPPVIVAGGTTTTTTTPPAAPTPGTGFLGTLPTLGFTPAHGAVLYGTEPWYDPTRGVNGAIAIAGGASYLPAAAVSSGNLEVHLNGIFRATITSSSVGARGGEIRFNGWLPAYVDPSWVHREINIAIVDGVTERVFARGTNIIYDLRREGVASPSAKPEPFDGMSVHFMPSGIGDGVSDDYTISLETPHLSSLPLDGVPAFNAELHDALRGAVVEGQPIDVCFNLDDADAAFRTLPQYAAVLAEAVALYGVYEAWENGGEEACLSVVAAASAPIPALGFVLSGLCSAAMSTWCVKDIPRTSDFEICFSSLEADPQDLSIDDVDDVQLSWGFSNTGAVVNAQLALEGIEARVDGLLRSATVRWEKDRCEARPSADVPDSALESNPEAAAASLCPDLELNAEIASTTALTGGTFLARRLAHDDEQVEVIQTADPALSLVDPEIVANKGLCEDLDLWTAAEALVEAFQSDVEDALSDTWNAGDQQAQALEELLQRMELGLTDHEHYALEAEISTLRSESLGADVAFETRVQSSVPLLDSDDSYYYHPAGDAPFSPNGMDPDDFPIDFDMAFTLTTGFLNQVISTQSKTDLLYIEYAPSWEELEDRFGATPANTGHPNDPAPPLDGSVLAYLHPAFAELGSRTVEIHIRPTLDPLAWMNPDPPPPANDADLAVGVGGLEVVFSEPDRIDAATGKPVPGLVWLTARYNLRETDFDLSIEDGSNVLAIPPELSTSYLTIISHRFTGCPMMSSAITGSCEEGLADTLDAFMRSLIEPRMLGMLTRLPVPNVWDAQGEAGSPVELRVLRQLQMSQNITFVVDIEDL